MAFGTSAWMYPVFLPAAFGAFIISRRNLFTTVPPPHSRAFSLPMASDDAAAAVASNGIKLTWEPSVADAIRKRVVASRKSRAAELESGSSDQLNTSLQSTRRPYLVALVGIPGSGKSTSSGVLSSLLSSDDESRTGEGDSSDSNEPISNVVMPMDGYHYPLEALRSFENAEDVIYRRGAPDTFDAAALRSDLKRISNGSENIVKIPGFDHAKGDPEPDAHTFIRNKHEVVICEGLYLLHDGDGWEGTASAFDLRVFVSADVDTCIARLKERNKCIPGYTAEEIDIRCDAVDRVNAYTVMRSRDRADIIVQSAA